jgi:hypothetical protein
MGEGWSSLHTATYWLYSPEQITIPVFTLVFACKTKAIKPELLKLKDACEARRTVF